MRLWVDADACPREAKEIIFRSAERLSIRTVLVANARLTLPSGLKFVTTMQVAGGFNVADAHIADEAQKGDVAITADIPLAAQLVRKGVEVLDPRGEVFTADSIEERLNLRDFMQEMREAGVATGGPKPFDARARQQFANALDRILTAAARRR